MQRMCLGTWQFEKLSDYQAEGIIETAHEIGIHQFDTAHVYAGGRAEHLLGRLCTPADLIITKIPARSKSETTFTNAYPDNFIAQILATSIERLQRTPDVVLLHNWHPEWESTIHNQILNVRAIVKAMGVRKFGLSLPDGYKGNIEGYEEYKALDVLEVPFNDMTPAIDAKRLHDMTYDITMYARSLMQHGKDKTDISKKFKRALDTGAHIVVGASSVAQVREWEKML